MGRCAGRIGLGLLCGLIAGLAACAGDDGPAADVRLHVVASTTVIGDWVGQVGGDDVRLTTLASAGADAHTLQLEPSQVIALSDADLVIINGGGLEASFEGVIDENAGGPIIRLADGIELAGFPAGLDGDADGARGLDPHFWLDPAHAIVAIERIRDELVALDPDAAERFRARAASYIERVRAADTEIEAALSALPPERRILVTFHDAYGYFARRYGLTVLGFVVEGPEGEPSAADIAGVIEAIEREDVAFVYREPQFSAGIVDQVAAETGATVREIYSLPTGEVKDYIGLLRANAAALSD